MQYELTATPTALPSITADQVYVLPNNSRHVVYVETTDMQPTEPGAANRLHPAGSPLSVDRFKAAAGDSIYVWTSATHPDGSIVYREEP